MPPRKKETVAVEQPKQPTYEELQSEVAELKKMMMSLISEQKTVTTKQAQKEEIIEQQEYKEILPNKRIKITSLYDGILILVAGAYGQGKPYTFTKFGQSHTIIYSDLAEILHYQFGFAERGLFFIHDDGVISNHGLYDIYQKLLSKNIIEHLLDYEKENMTELYKNATDVQKEIIANILAQRLASGEELDLNKIDVLSRIYGKSIVDLAEEYKVTTE